MARPIDMRTLFLLVLVSTSVFAQQPRTVRRTPPTASQNVQQAEMAVKNAIERFGNERKALETMLEVHAHIRNADRALVDPMQPSIAIQKAFEEISEAQRKNAEPFLDSGLIRARNEIDAARKSPMSADLGRLRGIIRGQALGPSSRLVVRTSTTLQRETLAWISVQELIATHMKSLAEVTGEGLRTAQEE